MTSPSAAGTATAPAAPAARSTTSAHARLASAPATVSSPSFALGCCASLTVQDDEHRQPRGHLPLGPAAVGFRQGHAAIALDRSTVRRSAGGAPWAVNSPRSSSSSSSPWLRLLAPTRSPSSGRTAPSRSGPITTPKSHLRSAPLTEGLRAGRYGVTDPAVNASLDQYRRTNYPRSPSYTVTAPRSARDDIDEALLKGFAASPGATSRRSARRQRCRRPPTGPTSRPTSTTS